MTTEPSASRSALPPQPPPVLRWSWVAGAVVIALLLRALAYDPWSSAHADELWSYVEQAHRMVDGWGFVTWEAHYGIRSPLVAELLAGPWRLGRALSADPLVPMHVARITFAAVCLLVLAGAWWIGRATSRFHAMAALLVTGLWWESIFYSVHALSEAVSAAFAIAGAGMLLLPRTNRRLVAAGFLCGMAALFRFQNAPFVVILVLWEARLDRKAWACLIAGGCAALGVEVIGDLANHQTPFQWVFANLQMNIADGRAAGFGTAGPLAYIKVFLLHIGPGALFILPAAFFAPGQYRGLQLAAAAHFVIHSAIPHKEFRFVWLALLTLLIVAAIGSVEVVLKRLRTGDARPAAVLRWIVLVALWMAANIASGAYLGWGAAVRSGGSLAKAASRVSASQTTCGIALPDRLYNHVISAQLRRRVPLYVVTDSPTGKEQPVSPRLAASANVIISDRRLDGTAAYRETACTSEPAMRTCTYVRPGQCTPVAGAAYEYQAVIRNRYF